jgi:hypothetical protein
MRWYQHLVDSGDDPDIMTAVRLHGHHAYYVFFRTLEIIGREFNPATPGYMRMSFIIFSLKFQSVNRKVLLRILSTFQKQGRIFSKRFQIDGEEYIHINCPKLRKLLSDNALRKIREYKKKTGSKPGRNRLKEKEKDKDKEKRRERVYLPKNKDKTILHPIDKLTDPKINKTALKDLYDDRVERKVRMTSKAIVLCVNKLIKHTLAEQRVMIDDSIEKGWKTVFPSSLVDTKAKPKKSDNEYFDPYDTTVFKKGEALSDAIEIPEDLPEDEELDIDCSAAVDNWDELSTEEKKLKWRELKKKAFRTL